LNLRPFGCKPNALTAELSALTQVIVQEATGSVNAAAIPFFCVLFAELARNPVLDIASLRLSPSAANLFAISLHAIHFLATRQRFASKSSPAAML
jgi:hypothetical protein